MINEKLHRLQLTNAKNGAFVHLTQKTGLIKTMRYLRYLNVELEVVDVCEGQRSELQLQS